MKISLNLDDDVLDLLERTTLKTDRWR